ncbi:MAG: HD domain-containing protein [Lachnospiraceae bacterium]|nr:HD domain-containing protein [Lachnospiraceae bacterium]
MTEEKQLEIALKIAEEKHAGQVDKQGVDYIHHPIRVMNSLSGGLRIAGILHDVIEDTDTTEEELLNAGIERRYVDIVTILTRKPDTSYYDYIQSIRRHPDAVTVKLADLRDNLRDGCPEKLRARYNAALDMLETSFANTM